MSLLRALGRNEHNVQSVSVLLGTTSPQSEYTKKKYRGTSQVYAEDLRLFHTVSSQYKADPSNKALWHVSARMQTTEFE